MPYTKAALQAPGSADLTHSLASSSCRQMLFPEHHVRTVVINLYISIYAHEPSIIFGTVLFAKKLFAFTLMQVRKRLTALVPSVMKSDEQIL